MYSTFSVEVLLCYHGPTAGLWWFWLSIRLWSSLVKTLIHQSSDKRLILGGWYKITVWTTKKLILVWNKITVTAWTTHPRAERLQWRNKKLIVIWNQTMLVFQFTILIVTVTLIVPVILTIRLESGGEFTDLAPHGWSVCICRGAM